MDQLPDTPGSPAACWTWPTGSRRSACWPWRRRCAAPPEARERALRWGPPVPEWTGGQGRRNRHRPRP